MAYFCILRTVDCKDLSSRARYDTTVRAQVWVMASGQPMRWTRAEVVKTLEVMHCPTEPFSASLAHLVPAYRGDGDCIK